MFNISISILGSQILSEIINEIKLFSKYEIKFYDNLNLFKKNAKYREQLIIFFLTKENEEDYKIEDSDENVEEYETDYDIVDETDIPEENGESVKGLEIIGKSMPIHKTDTRYNLRSKTKTTLVDYSDEGEAENDDEAVGNNSEEHILKSSQYVFDNCGEF